MIESSKPILTFVATCTADYLRPTLNTIWGFGVSIVTYDSIISIIVGVLTGIYMILMIGDFIYKKLIKKDKNGK